MMTNGTTTPEIAALRDQLGKKVAEGKSLLSPYQGKVVPADIEQKAKAVFGEIDGLKASLSLFDQQAQAEQMLQPTSAPVAFRPAIGEEGNELPVDGKSWRAYEYKNARGEIETKRYLAPLAVYENVKSIKGLNGATLTQKQYERAYNDGFDLYQRKGKTFVQENYPVEYKALSEGADTAGGFTVPVDFQAQIIKKNAAMATVRQNASIIQTSRDIVVMPRVPYSATASDDSGNKRFTSAVRMTWGGETPATSTTARVTDQTIGQIEVKVNTAISSQLVSNDLLEDNATDLAGYVIENTGEAFALGENYAFLQGSGVAQPMGIVTMATLGTSAGGPPYQASGTSADIQTSGDAHSGKRLMDVFYNVPAQYRANAVWMMSSITLEAVENLVDGNKRPLISSLIGGANLGVGSPDVIKGRPIVVDEFMPDYNAANAFGVLFGDMKGYTIVDRVQFSIQRYTELYVETNFTLFLARKRVGGNVVQPWRFQFLKSATS